MFFSVKRRVKKTASKDKYNFLFGICGNFHRNGFNFGIIFKGVFAQFAANSGLFKSAKWCGSVENVVTVYPHGASSHIFGDVHRIFKVLRVDGSGETKVRIIAAFNDLDSFLDIKYIL